MDGKASESVILRDRDGLYWLQTLDAEGRRRSCYLGHIRRSYMVRSWCELRGIPFHDLRPKDCPGIVDGERRGAQEAGMPG
jgi:hypothetical protein